MAREPVGDYRRRRHAVRPDTSRRPGSATAPNGWIENRGAAPEREWRHALLSGAKRSDVIQWKPRPSTLDSAAMLEITRQLDYVPEATAEEPVSTRTRISATPPMPGTQRRELDVLREECGELGFALWRVLSDVILWCGVSPERRSTMFHGGVSPPDPPIVTDARVTSASGAALQLLGTVATQSEILRAGEIADACATIRDWAEGLGFKETALQFAEACARAVPESSPRSYEAGGLCRRAGEFERGTVWFQRAVRLARTTGDNVAYANAQRGFGSLLLELGRFREAEPRLHRSAWAARKAGRRRLAGAAYHDLLVVTVHEQRWAKALDYANRAATLYGALDPRLPRLAHDVAYMWCRHGFFSSALPIFERLPPLFEKEECGLKSIWACDPRCLQMA